MVSAPAGNTGRFANVAPALRKSQGPTMPSSPRILPRDLVSKRLYQPAQKVLSSRGRGILLEIKKLKCRRGASASNFSDADIEQKTRP